MSRYCGEHDAESTLKAADHWREKALVSEGSVFSQDSIWTTDGLAQLDRYFIKNIDESDRSFVEKLKAQLSPVSGNVKRLAAELLWVMFLCPSNIGADKKREIVQEVHDWSGVSIAKDSLWLSDAILAGVGSAGIGFNNHRWRELVFAIRFAMAFKACAPTERARLLGDAWIFAEWLTSVPDEDARQFRHMLLYLLFPNSFERIFSGGDHRLIVQKFRGLSATQIRRMSPIEIDRELASIRKEEEAAHPGKKLDFYLEPLVGRWRDAAGFDQFTAEVEIVDVRAALSEIDRIGVPSSAESTVYDLIDGTKRYPPKLVLSLAAKHASGKEFDRTLFSGGIDSAAFKLLKALGFQIERKDFVETLLTRFLEQANKGDSQSVRGYPDMYRGLAVKVSFGYGSPARVPWIAFLGYEQETQKGIYPVFLYYKAERVLILAKGISDTEIPTRMWPPSSATKTTDQYFVEHIGRHAEKYKESLVFKAYRVPDEIRDEAITRDLDEIIAAYHSLMSSTVSLPPRVPQPTARPAETDVARAPISRPYTVKEATEALFISQERFEQILEVWKNKKNLVIQGPPGVGKTFFFRRLSYALMGAADPSRMGVVQFHPSYGYEDFVQGYRPSGVGFALKDGVFHRFCEQAKRDVANPYVFVIDEINRGNLAKIFGELLTLLEADKRNAEWSVPLAYGATDAAPFFIPPNLHVLGLMNTADRSLAAVDYALRRRFAFVTLQPEFASPRFKEHLTEKGVAPDLIQRIIGRMSSINEEIAKDKANLGSGFCVGHSFFCDPPEESAGHEDWYQRVVLTEIGPLLEEYYFDDLEKAQSLLKRLNTGM